MGAAAALLVWLHYTGAPEAYSDFDIIWYAGRHLLAGENPYLTLADYRWPPYYPLPAFLVGIPFGAVSLMAGRCLFAFITGSVATWAVLRHHPAAALLLISGPFLYSLQRGQWSPLILAACLIPAWGCVAAIKPTIGAAAIAYRPTRVGIVGAVALMLVSLLVLPRWPMDWLVTAAENRHLRVPLLLPGGFLLAGAILRWRRPETRLFLVLASVPQTIVPYELLPLAVVPRTRREVLFVAIAWALVYFLKVADNPVPLLSQADLPEDYFPYRWWAMLLFGYLPILAIILRRPNTVEERVARALTGTTPPPIPPA